MIVQMTDMLDAISRRPAEYAWIETCRLREAARDRIAKRADVPDRVCRTGPERPALEPLEHLTLTAMDRCVFLGWIAPGAFAVLAKHGATGGPDRTDIAVRQVWDGAIDVLESEMNRLVFPPPPKPAAPTDGFFWGPRGTPFVDAANAWWWTLDCLDARKENRRENSALRVGRPCEPDDVVNAMRRLNLPPIHARTVMAWGKKRDKPPRGTAARQYWDEAMTRLDATLRARGIVQAIAPANVEPFDVSSAARPARCALESPRPVLKRQSRTV